MKLIPVKKPTGAPYTPKREFSRLKVKETGSSGSGLNKYLSWTCSWTLVLPLLSPNLVPEANTKKLEKFLVVRGKKFTEGSARAVKRCLRRGVRSFVVSLPQLGLQRLAVLK
jgi:hypothetical protein